MATVTGYTAERMQEIEDGTIVDGNVVNGDLILIRRDLQAINAGSVIGPQGPPGTDTSIVICTSATRPTGGALFEGLIIYETDTKKIYIYTGTAWVQKTITTICTSATRPTGAFLYEGLEIYETDTDRKYIYSGSAWVQILSLGAWDTTFVPALQQGANSNIGKTVNYSAWTRSGRKFNFEFKLTATASGPGSGGIFITIPVLGAGSTDRPVGYGNVVQGASDIPCIWLISGGGVYPKSTSGSNLYPSAQIASGHVFSGTLAYQAAS